MTMLSTLCSLLFFFQAEDGIRYLTVTGVQTCALPILQLCHRLIAVAPDALVLEHLANDLVIGRGQVDRLEERSEEHTSELQSQSNLVCRLLLEKKKLSLIPRHV